MEPEETNVQRDDAQLNGRDEGPRGSDNTTADARIQDNKRRDVVDDSANGLDSVDERGGQNGRNIRGIGGMDMDSKNGVLRMGDMDDSKMEVTPEGEAAATGSSQQTEDEDIAQTGTSIDHKPTY
jgi:glutamate synthase domain-containing protein 1